MNHYPRHIGDWMRDTAHLSEVEECIYSRMIDMYYSREKPLPVDTAATCRLVRATGKEARGAVGTILAEFFVLKDDGWHQKRCDQELEAYQSRADSARQNGRLGGRPRNPQKTGPVISGLAKQNPNETHAKANQEPVTSNQEPVGRANTARRRASPPQTPLPDGFAISDRVRQWAATHGHGDLEAHFDGFVGRARAKGYRYVDWDEAFMTAVRENWAKVAAKPRGAIASLSPVGQRTAQNIARWMESEDEKNGTVGP